MNRYNSTQLAEVVPVRVGEVDESCRGGKNIRGFKKNHI